MNKYAELKKKHQEVPPVLLHKLDELKEKGYITGEEYALFRSHLSGDDDAG